MENIIIEDLGNGYVRLTAEAGKCLYSLALNRAVSVAVVKPERVAEFVAR